MIREIVENLKLSDREKTALPISIALLVIAAILRTQPHISNVTPFFAVSILVGFLLGPKRAGLAGVMSVVAMFFGDLSIGLHWTMLFVYAGIAVAALSGSLSAEIIASRKTWISRTGVAFLVSAIASTVFFILSNFGVWLVGVDAGLAMYPMTFGGLVTCFEMAIPFFTKSLSSDITFGTGFILVATRLLVVRPLVIAVQSNGR